VVTDTSNTAVPPESSTQYEFGVRTYLFNNRLNADVAIFQTTRANFLQTVGPVELPIGQQRTQGVEIDINAQPINGWAITGNDAYQDARYTSLAAPNTQFEGNFSIGTPLNTASLFSTYEFQQGALRGFGFGGGLTYRSGVYVDEANTQKVPGYVIGNLVFFYHQKNYDLQLNISNFTDEHYFVNGIQETSGASPGASRTFTGSVTWKF
jgi:iron complex outermembrane receptor protein